LVHSNMLTQQIMLLKVGRCYIKKPDTCMSSLVIGWQVEAVLGDIQLILEMQAWIILHLTYIKYN